jgi:hypothetical protein
MLLCSYIGLKSDIIKDKQPSLLHHGINYCSKTYLLHSPEMGHLFLTLPNSSKENTTRFQEKEPFHSLCVFMDKLKLTGQSLGCVFNLRVAICLLHMHGVIE